MRVYPECFVCLFRSALRAAQLATPELRLQRVILRRLAHEFAGAAEDVIPVEIGQRIQAIVQELTGVADPYKDIKRRHNEAALALYPRLKDVVVEAEDPLLTAIRLAIAGNVIDLATGAEFDLERAVQDSLERGFAIFDYSALQEQLEAATEILYLGDNAGEIVFDKLLVEELLKRGKHVVYAVRGGPAINDATLADAYHVGLDRIAEVITGPAAPGTMLKYADPKFLARFRAARLIISKGQGNFEGLSEEPAPLFFLLKAKCAPIAQELGVTVGALVLRAALPAGIRSSGERG